MTRRLSIIGLLICIAALGAAYFMEYQYMLAVCPLCILQRIVFFSLGSLCLVGVLFNFTKLLQRIYAFVIMLTASAGILLAGRQLWLQYFAPPQSVSCSASLERLIKIYPLFDALKIAITGSGECAEIDFTILGLSLAAWCLVLFALFFVGGGYLLLEKKRRI